MVKYFIGIDPGMTGGIAVINDNNEIELCIPMPVKNKDIDSLKIASYLSHYMKNGSCMAVLEKVGAMPGQGVCAMFTFGKIVGQIKSALQILKVPFQEVRPQDWKSNVLAGLKWSAKLPRYVKDKNLSPEEEKAAKKKHDSEKRKMKKEAKMVACQFVINRFPNIDLYMGSKNPHDGMAEAVCMALHAKQL